MARPSTYDEKLAERILDAVCEGASLTEASAACDVPRQTVRGWLDRTPAFSSAFDAAKLVRVEALADQINILADSAQRVASDAAKAGENPNAAVAALRVQCENKRWLLAKLAPATYGDRITQEHTGPGGRDLMQPPETDPQKIALLIMAALNNAKPKSPPDFAVTLPVLQEQARLAPPVALPAPVEAEPVRVVPLPPQPTEAERRERQRYLHLVHGLDQ